MKIAKTFAEKEFEAMRLWAIEHKLVDEFDKEILEKLTVDMSNKNIDGMAHHLDILYWNIVTEDICKEAIMININKIKINQKVWFKESWTERIVCGFVNEITKRSDNEDYIIEIKGKSYSDDSFIGTTHQSPNNLFATKEEAIAAAKKENQKRVDNYKAEITDIASLVAFPLTHTFGAEEYTDYEAIRAYKERAKELGFKIPD